MYDSDAEHNIDWKMNYFILYVWILWYFKVIWFDSLSQNYMYLEND